MHVSRARFSTGWIACIVVAVSLGCALPPSGPATSRYDYFAAANPDDAWYAKIQDWQQRELSEDDGAAGSPGLPTAEPPLRPTTGTEEVSLRQQYAIQTSDERRELAQRFMTWSQIMAREHYRKDADEVADPWPTTEELLAQGGDDCDGLDLLAYSLLRDFGYARNELFRAIIRRERDRANHMVTLWFEDPRDPWVIDATGAISLGLKRMSQLDGWLPTRVFNEHDQFAVVENVPADRR